MITELKQITTNEDKKERWHKVYFHLPRTIEANEKIYRVYKEWIWKKGTLEVCWESCWWNWEYSLTKPKE